VLHIYIYDISSLRVNVHYKCVTPKYDCIMDQVCYESSKSSSSEVCTEMNIETVALIDKYQHFFFPPMKMEVADSSKTLVTIYRAIKKSIYTNDVL
jgi:hypothetical protein